MRIIQKKNNTYKLLYVSKAFGLEVNAGKIKYMVMSQEHHAVRYHSIKIDNSPFERVEKFKYLGTNLTNHCCIQEEIKNKLKSGNAATIRCRIFSLPFC